MQPFGLSLRDIRCRENLGLNAAIAGRQRVRRSGPLGIRATAALEFAMVAPVFILFAMAVLGVGLSGFYQLTLDEAVRNAARQLQLAGPASTSGAGFVAAVCQEFGALASNCATALTYNVQSNVSPANFSALSPIGLSGSGALPNGFATPAANANVLIQVAYPLPFTLPYIGSAVTLTGTNSMLSTTTVRVEPHA